MSLFTVATVNSPVGYPFKFHIKAIHEKEDRKREKRGRESSTNCVDRSELPFGCAANSIGIILLCHCRNIMIFASSIPKEEKFAGGGRRVD